MHLQLNDLTQTTYNEESNRIDERNVRWIYGRAQL